MPIYIYKCTACKAEFDFHCSVEERRLPKKCPQCKKMKGEKQYSFNYIKAGKDCYKEEIT